MKLRTDATAWGQFDLEDGVGGAFANQPDGLCASRQDTDQRLVRAVAVAAVVATHIQREINVLDSELGALSGSRSSPALIAAVVGVVLIFLVVVVAVASTVARAVIAHGPQPGHIRRADCDSLIVRILGQRVGIGGRFSAGIRKEVVVEAVAGNGGAVIGGRVLDKLGWQLQEGLRLHDWDGRGPVLQALLQGLQGTESGGVIALWRYVSGSTEAGPAVERHASE